MVNMEEGIMKLNESSEKITAGTATNAIAHAVRISSVEAVPIYPITPQTTITEYIADFIANGELELKYIHAESEYSVMGISIGAAMGGARVFTASSSQGLAYMNELIHWAAGARLPIVMAAVNRGFGPPWTIHVDHQDTISLRDTGWIQLYIESNQEALDTTIQAFKIAEAVNLPVMVNVDGTILAYTYEPFQIPKKDAIDEFLPKPSKIGRIDPSHPRIFWSASYLGDLYMKNRKYLDEALKESTEVIDRTAKEFGNIFGRYYGGCIDTYKCDDAKSAILTLGTLASTARLVVDKVRKEGRKIGLIKLRAHRPFPSSQLQEIIGNMQELFVIERGYSYGCGAPITDELKSKLYKLKNSPEIYSYVTGKGGQDVTVETITDILARPHKELWYLPDQLTSAR